MEKRFLYEVRPIRPIHIPGKVGGRKIFTALLNIDEVKQYMQYGPVYRKFADPNKEMVLVTGANISNLHRDVDDISNKPIKSTSTINTNKVEESELKKSKEEESTTVSSEEDTIKNGKPTTIILP